MVFQRPILENLFSYITFFHHVEPWKAICRCVDRKELFQSPISEYEIYFNFVWLTTDQGILKERKWMDLRLMKMIRAYQSAGFDYVVCHEWARIR